MAFIQEVLSYFDHEQPKLRAICDMTILTASCCSRDKL